MNEETNSLQERIEAEIARQIEAADRSLDRSGWFTLIGILIVLFLGVYLIMSYMNIETESGLDDSANLVEQVEELSQRVESLEASLQLLQQE